MMTGSGVLLLKELYAFSVLIQCHRNNDTNCFTNKGQVTVIVFIDMLAGCNSVNHPFVCII